MKVLVVHGVTMTGPAMLRHLGPLGEGLRALGLELVAPTAPCVLSAEALAGQQRWVRARYAAMGQDAAEAFADGVFWDGSGHHGDWFGGTTVDGRRCYRALPASLDTIREVLSTEDFVGVVGFSQGAAMASVILGQMLRGALPGGDALRFGILMCGFRPSFDEPALDVFPVPELPLFVLHGTRDPIFDDAEATVAALSDGFTGPVGTRIVEGLGHEVPRDPQVVDEVLAFVGSVLGGSRGTP